MIAERPKRKRGRPAKAMITPSHQYPHMLLADGSNKKAVAEFLNITVRAIDSGMQRLRERQAEEPRYCLNCGRRITGRRDKRFCNTGCASNYRRGERRLAARFAKLIWRIENGMVPGFEKLY